MLFSPPLCILDILHNEKSDSLHFSRQHSAFCWAGNCPSHCRHCNPRTKVWRHPGHLSNRSWGWEGWLHPQYPLAMHMNPTANCPPAALEASKEINTYEDGTGPGVGAGGERDTLQLQPDSPAPNSWPTFSRSRPCPPHPAEVPCCLALTATCHIPTCVCVCPPSPPPFVTVESSAPKRMSAR